MEVKKKHIYFLIESPKDVNLDYVKNTGAILILRKPENSSLNSLKKFHKNCLSKNIDLYVANNVKILFKLKSTMIKTERQPPENGCRF